jgi:hypothetical protein
MAQVVSHQLCTVEAQVQSAASGCGISGGQNDTVTSFSLNTSIFPSQYHTNNTQYTTTYQ